MKSYCGFSSAASRAWFAVTHSAKASASGCSCFVVCSTVNSIWCYLTIEGFIPSRGRSAADDNALAVDPISVIRGKEGGNMADVFGLTDPASRGGLHPTSQCLRPLPSICINSLYCFAVELFSAFTHPGQQSALPAP